MNISLNFFRERKLLKGDIPPRSSGGCGVVLGNTLYLFGGKILQVKMFLGYTSDLKTLLPNNLTI